MVVVLEETPKCNAEVCQEMIFQIGKTSGQEVNLGIFDGLMHRTRDPQPQKVNVLLKKVGKIVDKRIDGLVNFGENRCANRGDGGRHTLFHVILL